MTVMVVFETIEGQTGKIVQFIEGSLHESGHNVALVDTADKLVKVSFKDVHKVILAAPVHERRHPRAFEVFVAADRKALEVCETLMISVSLKAAFADGMQDAEDFLTEMETRTGFSATKKAYVAGAVRQGSYDYFSSQILRHVVLAGHDVQVNEGDQEFTDWAALDAQVHSFMEA